jgi:hypothetical protein
MSRTSFRALQLTVTTLFFLLASLPALADSQVRIVRLSYIEGSVQIDRGTGQYEKAMMNLPISQGTKLRTAGGRAEVEFEDGSTIRITPESTIEFPQLSLRDSGGKVSTVDIKKGTAYVDYSNSKNDEFSVVFGHEKVVLSRSARLRVGIDDTDAAVAVFKGDVQIENPSGTFAVKKNQTANFDSSDNDRYKLAKNIDEEPFDAWDKQQSDFHVRYASNSYNSYSPYAYGTSDLSYYGNFFNEPGYGMMWQPYFAGAGWDPFMNGAWAFSPGAGFGWVSAYPWGWTPYHYGTWVFLPGNGWAWRPGGAWTTWYSRPQLLNAPQNFAVPQAPTAGRTTVVVNRGPMSTFANQSGSKLVIRNNSAGLGVRRGEINNLGKVSQQVQTRGTVTEHVHAAPITRSAAPGWAGPEPGGARGSYSTGSRPMSQGATRPAGPGPAASAPAPRSSAPATSPGGGNRQR